MQPPESDLLVEEYKSCRDLIKKNIEIIESNEIYVIGASGASAIFSATSSTNIAAYAVAWLPLLLSFVGFLRYIGLDQTIHAIDDYIIRIETTYPALGYTSAYRQHHHGHALRRSRQGVWVLLIVLSAVFGTYVATRGPLHLKDSKCAEATPKNSN